MDSNGCRVMCDERWLCDDPLHVQAMDTVVCAGFYLNCYDGYKVSQ